MKQVSFKLRDALVVRSESIKGVEYFAFVRGIRVPLAKGQYLAARQQAVAAGILREVQL